jgi:hypothetical protein
MNGPNFTRLNRTQRYLWTLLAILILTTVLSVPAFAKSALTTGVQATRIGTAAVVYPKLETLRLRMLEETTASGDLRYTPVDGGTQRASPT